MTESIMKKKITEFPFESARRITAVEVEAARKAVKEQFDLNSPPVETRGILRCCYAAG